MEPGLAEEKARLRQQIRQRLTTLSDQECIERSARACSMLATRAAWEKADAILFYAPLRYELDIWPLIEKAMQSGKLVCLPRYGATEVGYCACQVTNLTSEIELGQYGIREPAAQCSLVPLNRLDLVLVPGVAFDLRGHRLGRGKGIYDRLLKAVRGTACGFGFDEQIVQMVPVEPHDSDVNCILTPTRWIEL